MGTGRWGTAPCMARGPGPQIQQQRLGTSEQLNEAPTPTPTTPSARIETRAATDNARPRTRPRAAGLFPTAGEPSRAAVLLISWFPRFAVGWPSTVCESARPLCQLALKPPTLPAFPLPLGLPLALASPGPGHGHSICSPALPLRLAALRSRPRSLPSAFFLAPIWP